MPYKKKANQKRWREQKKRDERNGYTREKPGEHYKAMKQVILERDEKGNIIGGKKEVPVRVYNHWT